MTQDMNTKYGIRKQVTSVMTRIWVEYAYTHLIRKPYAISVRARRTASPLVTDRESAPYGFFRTLLLLLLTLGSGNVLGQTNYSGTYFLSGNNQGVNSYDIANTTTNYYMCPTVDWLYYKADATNYFTDVDNGQPFITTYQYRNGVNDASEAVWRFVKHPTLNYYYIIHNKTSKYLVSNQSIKTATSGNRLRVHLEETDPTGFPQATQDYYLFAINYHNSGHFYISPKKYGNYLNINQGNQPSLQGVFIKDKNDGPTGEPTAPEGTLGYNCVGGIIGLWTSNTDFTSRWYIELFTPEISVDNCTFTLSYPIEDNTVQIRYTTDGTAPTASSTLYTEPFTPGLDAVQIKVTAFKTGISTIKSPTVTYNFSKLPVPTCELNQEESKLSLNTSVEDGIIYYKTGGANPTISEENEYTEPFPVTENTIVKAFVAKQCNAPSDIITHEVTKVATPTFELLENNKVKISSETQGATIYYNIGDNLESLEDPNTSSNLYAYPLTVETGKYFKAIAVKSGCLNSAVATTTEAIKLKCAKPSFKRLGNKLKISGSFPSSEYSIKYEIADNGGTPADPSSSSSTYTELLDLSSYTPPITVKAYVSATGYVDSDNNSFTISSWGSGTETDPYVISTQEEFNTFVTNVNTNANDEANKYYQLIVDVNGGSAITTLFTGGFIGVADDENGTFPKISGLTHPLFNTINGGVVKNIILDNVNIPSGGTNVGAICGEATGDSRIYNCGVLATNSTVKKDKDGYDVITSCSSTINGSGYVGGIVGLLDGSSRVINCFSYANVSGGTEVGGIVGHNNVATTSVADNQKTMVMNCMFYGEVSGSSKAPIYNGSIITNDGDDNGVNNFNYFWAGASYVQNREINVYNCALAAETRYLQRFEFFRHLLNSNRELAAWWATGSRDNKGEMAKWVLEPSQIGSKTPYPILKTPAKYPSMVNIDADHAETFASDAATKKTQYNQGRMFGTLTITIQNGSGGPSGANITTGSVAPPITDKDPAHFNYNYYKVQLPYYNDVGTGNYTENKVVTGWKIVSMSKSAGSFTTTSSDATAEVDANGDITLTTPYNFADRNCTAKDIYSSTNIRVFSQGAYFDVPEGVSSITIQPYWANCVYVSDEYPDVVFNNGTEETTVNDAMYTASSVTSVGGGSRFTDGETYYITDDQNQAKQAVYTSMTSALTALSPSGTVYDNAIVLVGNVHSIGISDESLSTDNDKKVKPYTIMSIDLDKDNEPDYSYILRFNSRVRVHPVRVDFLNIMGLGMAQKSAGGQGTYNFGILQPLGWFESTNTSLFRFTQFEYDYAGRLNSPMILQGGVIEQWVTVGGNQTSIKEAKSVTYYHVGSNVWFKEFHIGVHQDKTQDEFVSPHPPISVTGGDYDEFYLTGNYNTPNNGYNDDAECYINGGRFGKVAGTGMQGIGDPTSHTKGNITWQINNADIDEFYAGGINAAHISEGNIMTVISNSRVDQYCGGPKFGNMNSTKKVVTNATNCIFRTFFGAGYGGNSYNRKYPTNQNNKININWNTWVGQQYTNQYSSDYGGVDTRIDYQFLPMSSNVDNVCRLYVDYVIFSLATTHDVTSKLTDCTITTSPLGRLSISDDYKCLGSFYGGGSLGMVAGPVKSTLTNCTVEGNVFGGGYSATLPTVKVMKNTFKTEPHYDENLGAYMEAELPETDFEYTWEHRDVVNSTATAIDKTNHILYTQENLTGLGAVTGNVTLTIDGNTTLTDGKRMYVTKSVYGGGEESNVEGNTEVNITGGTITQNVFGGGKGEADEFTCSKAMVGVNDAGRCADPGSNDNKNKGTKVTISNGTVNGNVYGGGEVGRVEWNTQVEIGVGTGDGPFAPEINGSVFGAGKGKETHGYGALVRGNSSVTIQGNAKVRENVYGGGEQATVGRYWVKSIPTTLCDNETEIPTAPSSLPDEMPYKTRRGGRCTVLVQGNAQVGPNDGATAIAGHVFGAGKGVTPNYNNTQNDNRSKRMVDYNATKHTGEPGTIWDYYEDNHAYVWEYFVNDDDPTAANYKTGEDKYLEFLQTLALVTGTDVTIDGSAVVKGSVFGGSESGYVQDDTNVKVSGGTIGTEGLGGAENGNVYGGGKGDAEHTGANNNYVAAGLVKGNTKVEIEDGRIWHNVYGGGAYGSVGEFTYDATTGMPTGRVEDTEGGKAEVIITGGTIGKNGDEDGMVFGSSRGDVGAPGEIHDKLAWVYNTEVKIGTDGSGTDFTTPIIKGSVYGGGENGHVFNDASVYIYSGTVGIPTGETIGGKSGAAYEYRGNVYGAGCGTDKYIDTNDGNKEKYNPLAGIVQGNTTVNISGGHVVHNVYGAGAMGSVGTASVATSGKTTVTVSGGRIGYDGNSNNDGNIFGAARGDLAATGDLAQVRETEVNISYATTPTADNEDKNVQLIAGSVFGGGEAGIVKGSVAVSMTGGLVLKDVYGGGALAHTQTSNWDASANNNVGEWADTNQKSALNITTVRLTGGTILGEAYGGALGQKNGVNGATSDIAAYVYGDVLLDLNGTTSSGETGAAIDNTARGCVVGQVFGCNNINGSPKGDVMVHVYATQNAAATQIANTPAVEASETNPAVAAVENAKVLDRYDVSAVYGGGNMAAYVPVTPYKPTDAPTGAKTQVIIEGCTLTSIETVYGGGNAAAVPETNVDIKGAYEIGYLFGGGNGKDKILIDNVLTDNPGADIGQYHNGTEMVTYGTGNANSLMEGGLIHEAYGGSNTKGVLKGSINQVTDPKDPDDDDYCCDLVVDKIVGAGKYADIDGDVNMTLSCQPSTKVPLLFAGADEANVNGNITLNITNGNFGQVFGGNNLGGAVKGKITVNVEERGCQPIKIDELYLGGNEAAYSVYGYYESNDTHPVTGLKILKPRTAEMHAITNPTAEGYKEPVTNPTPDATHTFPYAQPELNIISCTYIGKVFGGGLGAPAKMYANPTVNVNMVAGAHAATAVPAMMTELGLEVAKTAPNPDKLGIIGDVFGGGNAADIVGNTTVNIAVEYVVKQVFVGANVTGYYTRSGAGTTADPFVYTAATGTAVEGKTYYEKKVAQGSAYIIGSVFGGGNDADVLGNTNVTMSDGYVFNGVFGGGYAGNVGTFPEENRKKDLITDEGTAIEFDHSTHDCIGKPTTCAEGTGKCTVLVDGGQIGPISVATQGEGMNRKDGNGKYDPVPQGWVWGGGQGLVEDPRVDHDTHFKSYVGSTDVTIGGTAFVLESIIGGGEFGRVLGDTKVTIKDHCQIGVGEGMVANGKPIRYTDGFDYGNGATINQFVDPTTTEVKSGTNGNALVECSHFPYGENIGTAQAPNWVYLPYDPYYDDFENTTFITNDHPDLSPASTSSPSDGKTWIGCVFAGGSGYMPYLKKDNSGNPVGYDWCSSGGLVEGKTELIISGGHILTNVYGGNEVTNVKGKCKVTMTGGTIGVPRTVDQIIAHPVISNLFGAGKGDQRKHFNKETNVEDVEIDISGGIIYGSVFGGGEDGHVLRDVKMTIGKDDNTGPVIGTWGTSYMDGNVFGGGRGFGGDAYTAGNVAGCVNLDIKGGTILGSVYGGGRLGSVGYGLYNATTGGNPTPGYGEIRDDDKFDDGTDGSAYFTHGRGHVDIEISGGTIGNDHEYIIPSADNTPSSLNIANIASWTDANWTTWKNHNNIPLTEFDKETYRLKHTKGGNVFSGGMGRFYQLDGTTPITNVDWWKLGCVKSTKLTVKGGTIKSNVYGGGELGQVVGDHTTQNAANEDINAGTEIIIQSSSTTTPTIGTEIQSGSGSEAATQYTFGSVFGGGYGSLQEGTINNEYPKLIAGLVKEDTKIDMQAGAVKASIYGGGEMASVGESTTSGETTTATGSTYVAVSGGTVGIAPITVGSAKRYFGGPTMGNVYGGGSGHGNTVRSGKIFKNTNVTISGNNTRIYHNVYGGGAYGTVGDFDYTTDSDNKVTGVKKLLAPGTGVATVTITGGTVGYDGKDNGMVFGSSRGDINEPGKRDDYTAWVYDTFVTIGTSGQGTILTTPLVKGSVYGSGENGHVFHNTDVKIYSGTVGVDNDDTTAEGYTVISGGTTYNGPEYSSRGNVYGGGCGTDTYTKNNKNYYNPIAGIVKGNTSVTMTGGHVVRAVYGGGSMGSVGTFTNDPNGKPVSCVEAAAAVPATETTQAVPAVEGTGLCTVTISGGKIGPKTMVMPNYYGNVFGAGRGEMHDPADYPNLETSAYFNKTEVTINGTAFVKGSVYGGAESGHVLNDTHVVINGSCQIGCGYDGSTNGKGDLNRVYTPAEWAYDVTTDNSKFLYECNSWPYQAPYAPYDKFADANGEYSGGSSADNARPTGTDGHTFYGNVFGGGSGSTPYAAGKWLPTAGCVEGNTTVEIKGGHILTSVYGGNEMSDVGAGSVKKMTDLEHVSADMFYDVTKTGGKCTVKMSGGTIGVPRTLAQIAAHPVTCYLFGAGKGDQRIFFNKTTNVKEVEVEVSGGKIYGSVFGGGEDGHVMKDVKMTIKDGANIGTWGTSYMDGNVFGGGRGFGGEALTAGNVGGSVEIDIKGGSILGSVYGGGRLGSVGYGLYLVDETVGTETPYGVMRPDNKDDRGNTVSDFNRGYITINISGGTIGNDIEYKANPSATDKQKMPTTTFDSQNHLLYTRGGNVFAGCMGRLYGLENELLPLWTKLGRCKQTELNITGGIIKSNVYGGAELGVVQQNTKVNITGGQVGTKIGTGSDAYYYGSVFGGGKGSTDNITYPSGTAEADKVPISEAGSVEGNVTVELNKDVEVTALGGKVRKIFGCNDMNGTPKGDVLVHIHATQNEATADIKTKATSGYDVDYVFGGGNNADYVPTVSGAKQSTEVIIEGCDLTSIEEVYGGGYGAATPGTKVEIRGTKIIDNVFGGGYGAGQNNPGANVGYRTGGTTAYGKDTDDEKAKTAVVRLMAGNVHNVYGGSNTKGDIRGSSSITNIDKTGLQGTNQPCCDNLYVDNIYGGGKDAEMTGGAEIVLGCMPNDWISAIYAGAENADVGNDVSLTLTSGKFERVFGGNKSGGRLNGGIEVNIEENPDCSTPIIIGELYGGGNEAPYSIYGYKGLDANGKGIPRTESDYNALTNAQKEAEGILNGPNHNPLVNVKAFTSIGTIFGGGYGSTAVMVGNPIVNINEVAGGREYLGEDGDEKKMDDATGTVIEIYKTLSDGTKVTLYPRYSGGTMGVIGNVFGGGNAAEVEGNPNVNIGTASEVGFESLRTSDGVPVKPVLGADIRGNVYGGGNNAAVTGDTNVVIGKKQ